MTRPRGRAVLSMALALAAAALSGCITVDVGGSKSPDVVDRFHVLDAVAPPPAPQSGRGPALVVRTFRGRDRFSRHVVRREPDGTITSYANDFWADEPVHAVTDAVREALAESGAFASVSDSADGHETPLVLGGQVLDFGVDASKPGAPPSARVRLRLAVSAGASGAVLHSGVFDASEPLGGEGLAGLGVAESRAVSRALADALAAWTKAGVLTQGR